MEMDPLATITHRMTSLGICQNAQLDQRIEGPMRTRNKGNVERHKRIGIYGWSGVCLWRMSCLSRKKNC